MNVDDDNDDGGDDDNDDDCDHGDCNNNDGNGGDDNVAADYESGTKIQYKKIRGLTPGTASLPRRRETAHIFNNNQHLKVTLHFHNATTFCA